jgi:hypothetical protein
MYLKTNIRSIQSVALLIIFVFLKMGIAHAASHTFSHEEVADCEDCFLIIDTNTKNLFDFHSNTYEATTQHTSTLHKPIVLLYKSPIIHEYHIHEFFNKPPPVL